MKFNFKEGWNNSKKSQKIMLIIICIAAMLIITATVLSMTGIVDKRHINLILIPLLGLVTLANAINAKLLNRPMNVVVIMATCAAIVLAISIFNIIEFFN